MKESLIQKAILEYLAAERVLAFRMNTGAVSAEHNGKTRFVRFGVPGMADVVAFPRGRNPHWPGFGSNDRDPFTLWIEVKTATGKQSEFQKSFQAQVEAEGHRYIVARSVDDVIEAIR